MNERRVYGHSCRGRCGDRRKASHEYEVRTLLIIHFMATKVASDARPKKKVKFSALFAQKLHKNRIQLKGLAYIKLQLCNQSSPGTSGHTMSFGAFKLQLCSHTSHEPRESTSPVGPDNRTNGKQTRVKIVRQSGRTFQSKAESQ